MSYEEIVKKYPYPGKRHRHHISASIYLPITQLKVLPRNYPPALEKVEWSELFSNGVPPKFLDIGTGKGKFLIEMAFRYPEKNILGFEIKRTTAEWLQNIISTEGIPNAYVLWYNVLNGLEFIYPETIEKIFYLFPDPWPKARHSKRRVLTLETLNEFHRLLIQGGRIYISTDIVEIHRYHIELLESLSNKFYLKEIETSSDWDLPKTNKQVSCERRKKAYFLILAEKLGETNKSNNSF
ncbi:MAG: tRNA (guanosine(46)-N7)-methyltransferase TrmB [Ignavibacteria bacterium]|nr:tRNA (guanosine(46)-N7)-methyltransferase TrmB [Ignavibacteria bacterium]